MSEYVRKFNRFELKYLLHYRQTEELLDSLRGVHLDEGCVGGAQQERVEGALEAEQQARRPLGDLGRQAAALGGVPVDRLEQALPLVRVHRVLQASK